MELNMSKFFANMYGSRPYTVTSNPVEEREKRAVKVLGGLKITSAHIKRVQIGEDLVDVPKIEYVTLLEGQIKEVRNRLREAEMKITRLQNNQNRLINEIRGINAELSNKINLR
jgi:hypothetical protein